MINYGDYDIVRIYGAEYRGLVQYYLLAGDVRRLHRLRWVMLSSMLKTLAAKHRSTATKIAAKHQVQVFPCIPPPESQMPEQPSPTSEP